MLDVHPSRSQPISPLSQQPESPLIEVDKRDGSLPLYAMFAKINQEMDDKHVDSIQQHIDGLLVFVSPRVTSHQLHA